MRRLLGAAAAAALLSGCGVDSEDALRDTSRNLRRISSGDLSMRLVMRSAEGAGVGFSLRGPFSLQRGRRLPVARIAYTQIAGDRRVPATLISTGTSAYVTVAGTTYRLPPGQAEGLRVVSPGARGLDGLQLDVGRWIGDPESSDGPSVGGDETDRITGRLRIGPALHDVLSAARKAGVGRVPSAREIGRLDDAVTDSSVELLTGKDDRLLRRVRLEATLDVPARLRERLQTGARLRLQFELGVARPNRRVRVRAPSRSQPLP
jgi:hypothetical protein